mmetsp:Transcript_14415/g.34760  ORF Transcript_14415/g.34760 Transcript_14415/m.34760 type:complete len:225 (-) Transcript_14415:238-912(-)
MMLLLKQLPVFSLTLLSATAWISPISSATREIPSRTVFRTMDSELVAVADGNTDDGSPRAQHDSMQQRTSSQKRKWRFWTAGKKESSRLSNSAAASAVAVRGGGGDEIFRWTLPTIIRALAVFVLAGIAEIGGGWLVWKAVREGKPWWWALMGSLVLVLYGFIPTLQPTDSFGRVYAVYGGFFIALSFIWGWIFDGIKPDLGDIVGGSLAVAAVLVILFWPRKQ